jgi:hypothetical protein
MELDHRLTELARSLRIAYTSTRLDFDATHLAADGFHTGVVGQRVQGEIEGRLIAEAWLAAQTVVRQKPRPASRATP